MKTIIGFIVSTIILLVQISCSVYGQIIIEKSFKNEQYEPTWDSLDQRPLPKWYDQAKVGIFLHWGVYSVPTMGSEWFWINWRSFNNSDYVNYMKMNFQPGFTYQEFAKDFTAEHFSPIDWANLFADSGAKYVVLTSKHHDGYALWPSKYSYSWNSVDIGPHRDLIGDLSTAIREHTSLKFGLYHSMYEWYHPIYNRDRENDFNTTEFVDSKIYPELMELIEKYKPEVLWSDGDWDASDKYWRSTEFIAWLYNESPVKETIVTNDRWGRGIMCNHGDFFTCADRYNPGILQPHKWENAMTVDRISWGQRANANLDDFLTSDELIRELVITISCGGNILVNVGPTHFGTIEPIFTDRLREMGKWLRLNGEAIYESHPWKYQNDTHTPNIWYTTKLNGDQQAIYAIVLTYPFDTETVELFAVVGLPDKQTVVELLGYPEKLNWTDKGESIQVQLPGKVRTDKLGLNYAWTIKLTVPVQN